MAVVLIASRFGTISTEITERTPCYYAEDSDSDVRNAKEPSKTFLLREAYHQLPSVEYLSPLREGGNGVGATLVAILAA